MGTENEIPQKDIEALEAFLKKMYEVKAQDVIDCLKAGGKITIC